MLVLVRMRMLVMHVVMLALGCEHVRLRIEFANDETEQIGQFRRVPPPGAIAYAFDLHQRQRSKTAAQCRDDSGPGGCGHFLAQNASIGRIAFQELQRRRGRHW